MLCQVQSLLGRSLKEGTYRLVNREVARRIHHLCTWELGKVLSWMLGDPLANPTAKHHLTPGLGTSSNATRTTLPAKNPLSDNDIGPPFPLALTIIMIFH